MELGAIEASQRPLPHAGSVEIELTFWMLRVEALHIIAPERLHALMMLLQQYILDGGNHGWSRGDLPRTSGKNTQKIILIQDQDHHDQHRPCKHRSY